MAAAMCTAGRQQQCSYCKHKHTHRGPCRPCKMSANWEMRRFCRLRKMCIRQRSCQLGHLPSRPPFPFPPPPIFSLSVASEGLNWLEAGCVVLCNVYRAFAFQFARQPERCSGKGDRGRGGQSSPVSRTGRKLNKISKKISHDAQPF